MADTLPTEVLDWITSNPAPPCSHGPLKVACCQTGNNAGRWYRACSGKKGENCKGQFTWIDGQPNKKPKVNGSFVNASALPTGGGSQDLQEIKSKLEDHGLLLAKIVGQLEVVLQRTGQADAQSMVSGV